MRKKEFACSVCGKLFKTKACVERHENALHNDVKHACNICGQKFSYKEALASHILCIHQGVKKFPCPVAFCEALFSCSSNRAKHVKMAHREKKKKNEDSDMEGGRRKRRGGGGKNDNSEKDSNLCKGAASKPRSGAGTGRRTKNEKNTSEAGEMETKSRMKRKRKNNADAKPEEGNCVAVVVATVAATNNDTAVPYQFSSL